jgi:hypothetical protein
MFLNCSGFHGIGLMAHYRFVEIAIAQMANN